MRSNTLILELRADFMFRKIDMLTGMFIMRLTIKFHIIQGQALISEAILASIT